MKFSQSFTFFFQTFFVKILGFVESAFLTFHGAILRLLYGFAFPSLFLRFTFAEGPLGWERAKWGLKWGLGVAVLVADLAFFYVKIPWLILFLASSITAIPPTDFCPCAGGRKVPLRAPNLGNFVPPFIYISKKNQRKCCSVDIFSYLCTIKNTQN